MESVEQHLVRRDDRMILLLTPPFDTMTPSPGYIQGYVPGVRENGGQYTHAALWTVLAFARLGDGDRAVELFSMLNPLNHARNRRRDSAATAPNPTSSPPTSTRSRRTPAAAGGRGTPARRAGCIASASRRILGMTLRSGALHIDPCIPRDLAALRDGLQARAPEYRIVVENPNGVNRGVARLEVDGVDQHRAGHRESSTMARCTRCGWCWG